MNQNRLGRIVQIVWLAFAAFCIAEGSHVLKSGSRDASVAYLLFAIAVLSLVRFFLLRRKQLRDQNRI